MSVFVITGATGFIGANLAHRLVRQRKNVHIFIRPGSKNLWRLQPILKKIKVHTINLHKYEAVEKTLKTIRPDVLYHLSAYGTYPFHQDEELVIQTNINASANFFRAARHLKNLKLIVNAGSSSEYGVSALPMKESDMPHPNSLYAVAKLSQTFLAEYFAVYAKVPIVTLRFFSVYGPYEEPGRLIPTLLRGGMTQKPVTLSSPLPRRDFIYIEDVTDVLEKVIRRPNLKGEILNVGSGKDHSIREVVEIADTLFDKKPIISYGVVQGRIFDHNVKWEADITKIKKMLKWTPQYSLKQGLLKTKFWLRQNMRFYE